MIGENGEYTLTDGWYNSIRHNPLTDGNISGFSKDDAIVDVNESIPFVQGRIATLKTELRKNNNNKVIVFKDYNRTDTMVKVNASSWLLYHPNNTDGKPFWKNHFVSTTVDENATNASEWSGIGQTGSLINTKSNTRRSGKMDW